MAHTVSGQRVLIFYPHCPGPHLVLAPALVHVAEASRDRPIHAWAEPVGCTGGVGQNPCPLTRAQAGFSCPAGVSRARAQPPQPPPSANPAPSLSPHCGYFSEGRGTPGFLGKPQGSSRVWGSSSPYPGEWRGGVRISDCLGNFGFVVHLSRPG